MDVDAEEGTAMEPGSASLAATASLANKSIVLGYAFCLRNHLKTLYNITEQCAESLSQISQGLAVMLISPASHQSLQENGEIRHWQEEQCWRQARRGEKWR